jgi:hypothetical protein
MKLRSHMTVLLLALMLALPAAMPATAGQIPDGAIPYKGGYAVPLRADTPSWYTPELHQRVLEAGPEGVPIPEGVEVPQSALAFTGIRPGSWMLFPSWCTMNFVFGSSSNYYIGTAGHCASAGDPVTIVAAPGVLMNIGTTVTSVDGGVGNDFALIDVSPAMEQFVNPSMAIVAGPTGSKTPAFGDAITHVGHGIGIGTGGTPRAGIVTYTDATAYGWDGAAAPGDSGSAVRVVAGGAVGNLTHLVVGTQYLPAFIAGTSINRMLEIAGQPLATATLIPDPL